MGMTVNARRSAGVWGAMALLLLVTGCAAPRHPAPVEERSGATRQSGSKPVASTDTSKPTAATPVVEAKPGTYIVKPGDTLMRIALESGQGWRDLARWNSIENPNLIEVGQVLKVVPPAGEAVVSTKPVTAPRVDAKPLDAKPGAAGASASTASSASGAASSVTPAASAPAPVAAPKDAEDDIPWAWPASGPVVTSFDEVRSKGLAIGGKAGDAVLAAADGRVVYAGSGLRGYGNLVIVKHNGTYLTAYAHNQTLLVKEDQTVKRGQKIAEMGSSDAERVQLHFEIRRQGKPIDPAKLLPAR